MNKEKISVIVTLYNRLEYARNMIRSLLYQTKMIDELIFADDGSKDDVFNIISDLMEKCPFSIKHVYQEDIGFRLSRSRNNGAKEAIGDFLIFLDQDVFLPEDFIEKLYNNKKKKRILSSRAILSLEEQKNEIQTILNFSKNINYKEIYEKVITKDQDKKIRKFLNKDILYKWLYKFKLRSRGAKIVGLIFALYKEDYIAINGFDDKYKGWGEEDDDFGNRFFKYGGETYPVTYKYYPIHMFHPFASSKSQKLNHGYYLQRKKEISKKNFKCEYGYYNSLDSDKVHLRVFK